MTRRLKWALSITGVLVAGFVGLYWLLPWIDACKEARAIEKDWLVLARICHEGKFEELTGPGDGIKIQFKDGDWLAILYHDFHSDSLFLQMNYALGLTNAGRRIFTRYHFCGYEGLCGTLTHQGYDNLKDFLAKTASCGWQEVAQ